MSTELVPAPDYHRLDIDTMGRLAKAAALSAYFKDVAKTGDMDIAIAQAMVKIAYGQEIGLPPMQSVQNVHMVEGRLTLAAGVQAALLEARPNYDYQVTDHDEQHCRIEFYKLDLLGEWRSIGASSFSLDDAKRAKIFKLGGNWDLWPAEMVFARALTRGIRWHCPEVLGGTVYDPDEAKHGAGEEDPVVVEAPPPAPVAVVPPAPTIAASAEPPEPSVELTSPAKRGALVTMAKGKGLDADALAELIGYRVDRLPAAEYDQAKQKLQDLPAPEPPEPTAPPAPADTPTAGGDIEGMFR